MRKTLVQAFLVAFCAMLEGGCMNTRRDFIREGVGLAAILSSQTAPAILVRSMAAARHGIAAAKRGWVNPYVTDGLVAMWDGEWNAGGGVHDANATVWKDLSGNGYDFSLTSLGSFGDNCFINSAGGAGATRPYISGTSNRHQFEIVFSQASYNHYENLFFVYLSPAWSQEDQYGSIAIGKRYAGIISGWPGRYQNWDSGRIVGVRGFSFSHYNGAMYVNGVEATTNFITQNIGTAPTEAQINAGTSATTVYTMRLYDHALPAAEIAANSAIDKARFGLA